MVSNLHQILLERSNRGGRDGRDM